MHHHIKDTKTGACFDCTNIVGLTFRLILALGVPLVMIIYTSVIALKKSRQYNNQNPSVESGIKKSFMLKIIVNYVQIVSLIESIPIKWPGGVSGVMSTSNSAVSVSSNSFVISCYFREIIEDIGIPKPFANAIFMNLVPLGYVLVTLLYWTIQLILKRKKLTIGKAFDNFIATIIIIFYNVQSMIIRTNLDLLSCDNLYRKDSPEYYLRMDYQIRCWDSQHNYWSLKIGVPLLIFWAFVGPFVLFVYLYKNRRGLGSDQNIKNKYSYIYRGYRPERYYWEFIILLRKYALIALIHFMNDVKYAQIYFSLYIIWIAHRLQRALHPFNHEKLNHLEELGLMCALIFNFSGMYFYGNERFAGLELFMAFVALGANGYFFLKWLFYFSKFYREHVRNKMLKINIARSGVPI